MQQAGKGSINVFLVCKDISEDSDFSNIFQHSWALNLMRSSFIFWKREENSKLHMHWKSAANNIKATK